MAVTAIATSDDLVAYYGEDLLNRVFDLDDNDEADTDVVDAHLMSATHQIMMYTLGRYPSITTWPAHMKKVCCDIAIYNAAHQASVQTDEMRTRYEDAVRILEKIAKNEIKLEVDDGVTAVNHSFQSKTIGVYPVQSCNRLLPRKAVKQVL